MTSSVSISPLRAAIGEHSVMKSLILAIVGSLLLTLSARIQVPFFPVPMTLQVLAVLLIGAAYGARLAGATVGLYIAQGAVGLPVFAGTPEKGVGLAYMVGPTGGYLLGFLLAATLVGWLVERGWDRNPLRLGLAGALGLVTIYVPGLLWLGSVLGWDKPILAYGLWPFLPAEALKLALMVVIVTLGNSMLRRLPLVR